MKTLSKSITVLLMILSMHCFGQNISINDFLQLRTKDNASIESKLQSMKFDLYDSDEMSNGKTQYTYQNTDAANIATSFQWIDFVYAQDAQWNNRLSFQVQSFDLVKKYLYEIKSLGFYFTAKKIVDRQVFEVYSDGKNTIELITSQSNQANGNTAYFNFAFYSTDEYEYAFATENNKYNLPQINKTDLYADLVGLPMMAKK